MIKNIKLTINAVVLCFAVLSANSNATLDDVSAKPISNLSIVMTLGEAPNVNFLTDEMRAWYSHSFKDAMVKRIPEIFAANGIPVRSSVALDGPPGSQRWSEADTSNADVSYVLLLAPKHFVLDKGRKVIFFEASLWDPVEKKIVWHGYPEATIVVDQPLLRSQLLAAKLMTLMAKDGLIKLKSDDPVDLNGESITSYMIWTKDR